MQNRFWSWFMIFRLLVVWICFLALLSNHRLFFVGYRFVGLIDPCRIRISLFFSIYDSLSTVFECLLHILSAIVCSSPLSTLFCLWLVTGRFSLSWWVWATRFFTLFRIYLYHLLNGLRMLYCHDVWLNLTLGTIRSFSYYQSLLQ